MSNTLPRRLREIATDAEKALWKLLRNRSFENAKFRRQCPIGPYVADFACFESRLVVEADGGQHALSETDKVRTAWLESQEFRVLRFWNNDILRNPEGVTATIGEAMEKARRDPLTRPLARPPSPTRGEG